MPIHVHIYRNAYRICINSIDCVFEHMSTSRCAIQVHIYIYMYIYRCIAKQKPLPIYTFVWIGICYWFRRCLLLVQIKIMEGARNINQVLHTFESKMQYVQVTFLWKYFTTHKPRDRLRLKNYSDVHDSDRGCIFSFLPHTLYPSGTESHE